MTKVFELEGRKVTVHFKQIEINGQEVVTPGLIEVADIPYRGVSDQITQATSPQTRPQELEQSA